MVLVHVLFLVVGKKETIIWNALYRRAKNNICLTNKGNHLILYLFLFDSIFIFSLLENYSFV